MAGFLKRVRFVFALTGWTCRGCKAAGKFVSKDCNGVVKRRRLLPAFFFWHFRPSSAFLWHLLKTQMQK